MKNKLKIAFTAAFAMLAIAAAFRPSDHEYSLFLNRQTKAARIVTSDTIYVVTNQVALEKFRTAIEPALTVFIGGAPADHDYSLFLNLKNKSARFEVSDDVSVTVTNQAAIETFKNQIQTPLAYLVSKGKKYQRPPGR